MESNGSTLGLWSTATMDILTSTLGIFENSSQINENETTIVYCNLDELQELNTNTTEPTDFLTTTLSYEPTTSSFFENSSFAENVTSGGLDCVMPPQAGGFGGWHISCLRMFKFQFVVFGCLMGVMELLGFIFNWLSFIVMWPDRKTSPNKLLLLVLSMVDNMILVLWAMNRSGVEFCGYTEYCSYKLIVQTWVLASITHLSSVWLVLCITVQRYICVCKALHAPRLASMKMTKYMIVFSTLGPALFYIPRFFEFEWHWDGRVVKLLKDDPYFKYIYMVAMYWICIYVFPLSAILFMTQRLFAALKRASSRRAEMTSTVRKKENPAVSTTDTKSEAEHIKMGKPKKSKEEKRAAKQEHDVTLTLLVVVIVFLICQIGNPIVRLLIATAPERLKCSNFYFYWHPIGDFLQVFNSSTNFFIYCIFGKQFRKRVKRLLFQKLCPCLYKKDRQSMDSSTFSNISDTKLQSVSSHM